nr:zinc ribbon domain-containing protein [uncultured Sharpea sp.]
MKCPRCHHDVRQEDHFCPYCGYDLVEESKTRTKLYSFDSIASFKKNVSNADVFLEPINNYTTALNSQYQTQFDAQASFVIYSDYDVHINLVEKAHLSNNEFLTINRSYDRKQDDEITTSYTKSHLSHFDELTLKEREKISTFVPVQTYDALVNKLLKQKDVFEDKKDKIGHYGIGAYNKDASLVIYQDGEYYKSTLRVMTNGNHSLKR